MEKDGDERVLEDESGFVRRVLGEEKPDKNTDGEGAVNDGEEEKKEKVVEVSEDVKIGEGNGEEINGDGDSGGEKEGDGVNISN
jgi:hypothetical protein